MKKKYKLTWFSRFLIFSLFFVPITFGAVTFVQGENPIETIKKKVNVEKFVNLKGWSQDKDDNSNNSTYSKESMDQLHEKIDQLETKLMMKETEIKALKELINNHLSDSTSS